MEVHRVLGPGFLEVVYQRALEHELALKAVPYTPQKLIRVHYKGTFVADHYLDLLVSDAVVVELKAVERLLSIHTAQTLSYLKAARKRVGLLINFGTKSLDFRRLVL
ncbi:MAG: GxxExxY protein [Chloroflexi bacterium]|nr:GxxExxY protein [Chloroflexota bacterium]